MTMHNNALFVTIDQPSLASIISEFLRYKITLDRPIEVTIAALFLVVAACAGSVAAAI